MFLGLHQLVVALQDEVFEVRRTASLALEELCQRWNISKGDLVDVITDENLKKIVLNYKEESLEAVEEKIIGLEEQIEDVLNAPVMTPLKKTINDERKRIKSFLESRDTYY